MIDGATNRTTTIAVGDYPTSIAVNPVNNKIYVSNYELCGVLTVIDGATANVTRIKTRTNPEAVIVNQLTNQVYVYDPEVVTVVDGATNKTRELALPIPPTAQRSNVCSVNNP